MAILTPQVSKMAKLVPGCLKIEFNIKYPCTIHNLQFGTFLITFEKLQVQSLKIQKCTKMVLGV